MKSFKKLTITIRTKLKTIFVIISCLGLNGCIALTTTQSGRTVGKYNAEIGVCLTTGKYDELSELPTEGNYFPIAEINATFGASEKIDVGLKANSTSTLLANTKFQFLGNKQSLFAGSIGAEFGFNPGLIFFPGRFFYHTSPALFFSVHPSKSVALYLTPRYIYSGDYTFASPVSDSLVGSYYFRSVFASSYGLIIGQKHKIILEASCFNKQFFTPTQFSIGYRYFIPFKELLPNGKLF